MTVRLRVVTYNIHKCRGLDRRVDPDRIAAVLYEFDADVIALQEILDAQNGKPEWDQARRIHANFPGYQRCFGENRLLHGGAYGNMTLSRFPVQRCRNYDVSWRHRERRGCLRSDLLLPGGSVLHLFNVHLGTSFIERRHQARQLLSDKVLNCRECCGPRIVVGDFNEWTRGLASRLMGEVFEALNPRAFARYSRSYPGFLPLLHLDHFYYDRHLSLKSFRIQRGHNALVASDHLPMVAEFEIKQSS
ncbi:MAG TPA: endonuclease/exonuclease/phosphatase family protein [Candidatus Eisenbacteria bacterium]|jgi:endonuclease/exonuclease/phosphatase family metal-dependent hydrolase|nr:endonuclease/exonuclease/phosphatase family protein [Candidatus Eisenbacteria bacterium]